MLVIGHRGCSYPGYNQNTIRAYKKVIADGARAFEIDVQLTKDEQLVVVHNLNLAKVSTGTGLVREKTAEEVRSLYAGSPERGKDRIPLFSEVLDLCASYPEAQRPVLHLELKGDGSGLPAGTLVADYIERKLLRREDFLVSSFNFEELKHIRSVLPDIQIALLDGSIRRKELVKRISDDKPLFSRIFNYGEEDYMLPYSTDFNECKKLYEAEITDPKVRKVIEDEVSKALSGGYYTDALLDTASAMKAFSVNVWFSTLNAAFVEKAHARGFKVFAYTVNKKEDLLHLADLKVDGYFTDFYTESKALTDSL